MVAVPSPTGSAASAAALSLVGAADRIVARVTPRLGTDKEWACGKTNAKSNK